MASVFKQTYTGKDGSRKQSRKWYVKFVDHQRIQRRLPGEITKATTEELGRKLELLASLRAVRTPLNAEMRDWLETMPINIKRRLVEWGMLDQSVLLQSEPLAGHVAEYLKDLNSRDVATDYARTTEARITALHTGCGFVFPGDVGARKINNWLASQRKAKVFGISTSNGYVTAVRGFYAWMVENGRMTQNPVASLHKMNAAVDKRRDRRTLSQDDFHRLILAARTGKTRSRLSGPDRAMLYLTAAYTGLRAGELASLTEASFDFTGDLPTVTVAASDSKHRQTDVIPLNSRFAAMLQQWINSKRQRGPTIKLRDNSAKLWPGRWAAHKDGGRMVKADLTVARQAWISEGATREEREAKAETDRLQYRDETGKQFDFHSLRSQYVTTLMEGGVSSGTASKLARHASAATTEKHYARQRLLELSKSAELLPELPADDQASQAGA